MDRPVKLYELPPSPNNMKARIALNYKEIPFEAVEISLDPTKSMDEQDRSNVIAASTQPLTPVLVHGESVIFDSGSIMRYLEANFPKARPLFARSYSAMKEIEQWEWFGRTRVPEPVGIIFGQAFQPTPDPAECRRASDLMHELTGEIESRVAKNGWLAGDNMTAADVTSAPFVYYATLTPEIAAGGPLHKFFHDNLKLGEGRQKTRAWVNKVTAYLK